MQQGFTRAAGWQPARVLIPNAGLQELRAGSPQGFSHPTRAYKSCGLAAAGILTPNTGLQELRAGNPQGFAHPTEAYKSCGMTRAAGWQLQGL